MHVLQALETPAAPCGVESKTAQVIAAAETFILEQAVTPRQSALFVLALNSLQARMEAETVSGVPLAFVHLPLRVYAALRGDDAPAIPLAVATTLIYLGMDLLDDLADGDLSDDWSAYRPEEITLLGITLLTALPLRLFAEMNVPPATRLQMIGLMADAGIRLSAGQGSDLAGAGQENVTVAQVEASVEGKSGSEFALFAALAAMLAGEPPARVAHFAEMAAPSASRGNCFPTGAIYSRSRTAATRTLPIALYLERVNGTERQTFLDLLDEARHSADAQSAVREQLETSGIAFQSAFAVEVHCQRAHRLFREAELSHPAADGLKEMISRLSIFDALAISAR
jgi:geranylgeranyl pyrophosphate synthase